MIRLFSYLLIFGITLYLLWLWGRSKQNNAEGAGPSASKSLFRFRTKKNPMEMWVQVYETASEEEGRMIQVRLQEEEVECILYEQGKKGIQGNDLPGIGIAVPKSGKSRAQNVIARMPV